MSVAKTQFLFLQIYNFNVVFSLLRIFPWNGWRWSVFYTASTVTPAMFGPLVLRFGRCSHSDRNTFIHSFIHPFILSFFIFFASFFYSSSYLISHNLIVFFFLENENKPRKQLIYLFIYAVEFYITKLFTDGFLFKADTVKSWFIKTLRNHFKHEVGLPEPSPPPLLFKAQYPLHPNVSFKSRIRIQFIKISCLVSFFF